MRRLRFLPILVLLLVAATGCGGDDDGGPKLTLEEYLREVERLDAEFEQDESNIAVQFNSSIEGAANDEEATAVYQKTFQDFAEAVRSFVDGIDALNPPDEASDVHEDTVETGRDVVAVFNDLVEEAEEVESPEEAEALAQESFDHESFDRFDESCVATQELADDNGIEIELNCSE